MMRSRRSAKLKVHPTSPRTELTLRRTRASLVTSTSLTTALCALLCRPLASADRRMQPARAVARHSGWWIRVQGMAPGQGRPARAGRTRRGARGAASRAREERK